MIRAAEAGDAAQIAALWNDMIENTLSTFTTEPKTHEDIETLIASRPGAAFVAAEGDRVLGFVSFGSFRSGPGYADTVEHTILIHPDAKRSGTGRALMTYAEQAARRLGRHVMVAGISGANDAAVQFHAAVGFDEVGRMPQVGRKWDQWLDLLLMQKIL